MVLIYQIFLNLYIAKVKPPLNWWNREQNYPFTSYFSAFTFPPHHFFNIMF